MIRRRRQRSWLALAGGGVIVVLLGLALHGLMERINSLEQGVELNARLFVAAEALQRLQGDANDAGSGHHWNAHFAQARRQLRLLEQVEFAGLRTRDLVHQIEALMARAEQQRQVPSGLASESPGPAQMMRRAAHEIDSARTEINSILSEHVASLRATATRLQTLAFAGAAYSLGALLLALRSRQGGGLESAAGLNPLLAAAVRSTAEGVLISDFTRNDGGGTIVFVNRAFCHMIGHSAEELVGKPLQVLAEDHLRRHDLSMLSSAVADRGSFTIETITRREDGCSVHCEWHVSPVTGNGDRITHIVSALRDITDRKRQQEALLRSAEELRLAHEELRAQQDARIEAEKMAYLGQLATGVAHEINNPIGFAMSGVETLADELPQLRCHLDLLHSLTAAVAAGDHHRALHLVAQIDEHAAIHQIPVVASELDLIAADVQNGLLRARDIIEDLKAFARPLPSPPEPLHLNRLVEEALRLMRDRIPDRITTTVRLGDLPPIVGRASQLQQVITNLLFNAVQAIPASGTLRVETTVIDAQVILRVTDTGVGIPAEALPRIFTPFFTTRPAGKGTGLGLAIVYGFVKNHNGTIEVDSEPGRGTTFTVRLPVG